MSTVAKGVTKRGPNKNVAKVAVELEGDLYRFHLTRKGLVVRKHRSRKFRTISFSALVNASIQQFKLL